MGRQSARRPGIGYRPAAGRGHRRSPRRQPALQWLLQLAPNILLIPGIASVPHLLDNLAAKDVTLDDQALRQLSAIPEVLRVTPL